jgi:hypothetical protein
MTIERTLTFYAADGSESDFLVSVDFPRLDEQATGPAWACAFRISELPDGISAVNLTAFGDDGIQALQNALYLIGAELDAIAKRHGARIDWYGLGSHWFPMPPDSHADAAE